MASARGRLGAVAIAPLLLAAWQIVPLLLSPVSHPVAMIVLAAAALATSVGGVIAVLALARRFGDPPVGTQPQPQPRLPLRAIDRLRGWIVVLLVASPTAVLIAAVVLSDDLFLWVGVGIQIAIIVGVQVGLVILTRRNHSRAPSTPPRIT